MMMMMMMMMTMTMAITTTTMRMMMMMMINHKLCRHPTMPKTVLHRLFSLFSQNLGVTIFSHSPG